MPKIEFPFQLGDRVKIVPMGGVDGIVTGLRVNVLLSSTNRWPEYTYYVTVGETVLWLDADEIKAYNQQI